MGQHRRIAKAAVWIGVLYLFSCLILGILLAEISVHLARRPLSGADQYRERVQRQFRTHVEDVSLTAADGAVLRAWFVRPDHDNGKSVVLLHGVGGNRTDIAGFGDIFLRHGYSILLPDSRAHGASGGNEITYGILEREDVRRWVGWLRGRAPGCTYLMGESMGAAIGIEAAVVTPQLCAVAVESPYSTFREVSYERMGVFTHLGTLFWRTLGRPVLDISIVYTRLRYGIYLPDADPRAAIASSHVPVLLIAGTADKLIRMHHARELEQVCGARCSLWIVPGVDHGGAWMMGQEEFERRIVGWFESHDPVAQTLHPYRSAESTSR